MLICALFAVSGAAHADMSIYYDSHIYNEVYDENRVYDIYSRIGKATLLVLEDGEELLPDQSAIGMGDAAGWSVAVRGRVIVLKPTALGFKTNLVIATNRRQYAFDLKPSSYQHASAYVMRFRYPDTERKEREAALAVLHAQTKANDTKIAMLGMLKAHPTVLNTDYSWRGDNQLLKPTNAWDDGKFTYLTYDNSAELPNFYKILPDGTEALINTNVDVDKPNTIVLQEVIRSVRARLGKDVIEIVNNKYVTPAFNQTGTGDNKSIRYQKGSKND